ncbi:MAG: GTP-binding protein [Candidatus Njordarchaeales archaeon]
MVYKDRHGYYRFKIVFYGPSMAGKTTMVKALYNRILGLKKGRIHSVEDPSGRTLYFDYMPLLTKGKVLFDVYTVPGQKRHKRQRRVILEGADAVVFVADSDPEAINENVYSINELREFLGKKWGEIPVVIALNKRDLPDALPETVLLRTLRIDRPLPVFRTIAIDGKGVKRVFQEAARLAMLYRVFPEIYKAELENLARMTKEKLGISEVRE